MQFGVTTPNASFKTHEEKRTSDCSWWGCKNRDVLDKAEKVGPKYCIVKVCGTSKVGARWVPMSLVGNKAHGTESKQSRHLADGHVSSHLSFTSALLITTWPMVMTQTHPTARKSYENQSSLRSTPHPIPSLISISLYHYNSLLLTKLPRESKQCSSAYWGAPPMVRRSWYSQS